MSEPRPGASTTTVAVSCLLEALVIYLLTCPIVVGLEIKREIKIAFMSLSASTPGPARSWIAWYARPYSALVAVPLLDKPLNKYMSWWMTQLYVPRGFDRAFTL